MISAVRILWFVAITSMLCTAAVNASADESSLAQQRQLFRTVFESAERGNWDTFTDLADSERDALRQYALWPDLRAAYLRATIRTAQPKEIREFLDRFGHLKPGRELRYRHALDLVRRGDLDGYYEIYQSFYRHLNDARLDCLALQAELFADQGHRIADRGKRLWRIGKSQADECDPVFDYLKSANLLAEADYRDRYTLAIEAREFALARWLGKSIDQAHVEESGQWLDAQSDAEKFLRSHESLRDTPTVRSQLAYAAERLTYRDPSAALERWTEVSESFAFSAEQAGETARHIALWTARDNLDGAYSLLENLPDAQQDDEVLRWRARTSLRAENWLLLIADMAAMSAEERAAEEWRYWRAIALEKVGQINASLSTLEQLAKERSYYGFLAADRLQQAYAFDHSELVVDEASIDLIGDRPDLVRARELFLVGLDGRGRSEWDAILRSFSPQEKLHAAVLADRWGWHSRAIATVASVGQYDDLTLRYPLPFKSEFERHAITANISTTWAYGIARSESLFMRDVRSSAGAIGLMQLMPSTGRSIARELKLPYSGLQTLTDPVANIRLGTAYLAKMANRYDGNLVAATAAYNAGPHRVDRWLPAEGSIDTRIWIENIPYNETRSYVRRVMAAEVIFHWRLNGSQRRLQESLPVIMASQDAQRVASASR